MIIVTINELINIFKLKKKRHRRREWTWGHGDGGGEAGTKWEEHWHIYTTKCKIDS